MHKASDLPAVRLRRETLDVQVFQWLRDQILSGKLEAGTRLVQSELAKQLGTSRIPVRDALRGLAADGLLVVGDDRGTFTVVGLEVEDVEEIYEIRLRLEGLATRRAVQRMSDAERRALRELFQKMERVARLGDAQRYGELDYEFHLAVYEASHSRRLTRAIVGLSSGLPPLAPISIPGRLVEAHREHGAILEALEARDPEAAEAAAERHVRRAGAGLIAQLRGRARGSGGKVA